MDNVSKMAANWAMVIRTVVASIRSNLDAVASGAEAILYPDGPPAEARLRVVLAAMADLLEHRLEVLREAERTLVLERGDDPAARGAETDAYQKLRALLIRLRSLAEGTFDDVTVAKLGLRGATPENADAIAEYASTIAKSRSTITLPAPPEGITFDAAHFATALRTDVNALTGAQQAVAVEEREAQRTLSARDAAESALQLAYVNVADTFTAWALLAGRADIAERVRPTSRRRSGLPEPTDTAASGSAGSSSTSEGSATGGSANDAGAGDPNPAGDSPAGGA